GAEDLDRLVLPDGALGDQRLDGDVATLGEQLTEPVQVDDLVGRLEQGVGEALELRQTPLERHLATLEPEVDVGARVRALGAAARGLALGRLAATLADLRTVGAGGRPQVVDLERSLVSHD